MLLYGWWKPGITLSERHNKQISDDEQLLQQAPNLWQSYREASMT